MKTKDQKKAYLLDLARKGVINEEVLQQVIEAQRSIQR
jgi:hypothetical protein